MNFPLCAVCVDELAVRKVHHQTWTGRECLVWVCAVCGEDPTFAEWRQNDVGGREYIPGGGIVTVRSRDGGRSVGGGKGGAS